MRLQFKAYALHLGFFMTYFRRFIFFFTLLISGSIPAQAWAQMETRGTRDAAGAREALVAAGEEAPSLDELSDAYDRASASWMEVFGPEPFEPARRGVQAAIDALGARSWAPRATVVISMLDARGDAAWRQGASCRAQVNVGSDGRSPASIALGPRGFTFLAAHELAHCLFDQNDPAARLPDSQSLARLAPGLDPSFARRAMTLARLSHFEDGSEALLEAYDEALADAVAASALLAADPLNLSAVQAALSLRMGGAFLALRRSMAPPPHAGALALSRASAAPPGSWSLVRARQEAALSALSLALASPTPPRWLEGLEAAHPREVARSRLWARRVWAQLAAGRDVERDEDAYLLAHHPALFIMDLTDAPERLGPGHTPAEAMSLWRARAWLPSGQTFAAQ